MDLKKFAVRGIVVLAIFVALCMFFSGTIRTLTTPKVRLVKAKKGKLEERIEVTGKLAFPEKEPVKLTLPENVTLTIDRVETRVGYEADEGDTLIIAHVTNYEQVLREARKTYDAAVEEQMQLAKRSKNIRVSRRDQGYADAYYALRNARRDVATLRMRMDGLLKQEDKELPEEGYPKKASKELKAAIDAWREAQPKEAEAQAAFDLVSRYTPEDTVWTHITESHACQDKIDEAGARLESVISTEEQAKAIAAPHDGYIAELNVKDGDTYDGARSLYAITPKKSKPVLRADVSKLKRTIKKGTEATIEGNGENLTSKTDEQGVDEEGKAYVDIEISKAMIKARGNLYAFSVGELPITLNVKAKDSTILLPVSAVRGSGRDRFVYVAETEQSAGGTNSLKLRKMSVQVLSESNDTASLETDITGKDVAYMEDRALSEGATVMTYLN